MSASVPSFMAACLFAPRPAGAVAPIGSEKPLLIEDWTLDV